MLIGFMEIPIPMIQRMDFRSSATAWTTILVRRGPSLLLLVIRWGAWPLWTRVVLRSHIQLTLRWTPLSEIHRASVIPCLAATLVAPEKSQIDYRMQSMAIPHLPIHMVSTIGSTR